MLWAAECKGMNMHLAILRMVLASPCKADLLDVLLVPTCSHDARATVRRLIPTQRDLRARFRAVAHLVRSLLAAGLARKLGLYQPHPPRGAVVASEALVLAGKAARGNALR
jgi:hypothetical protein